MMAQEEEYPLLPQVMEMVLDLESMPRYPKTEKGIVAFAKAVCRIIQDQEKCPALESCRRLVNRALDDCEAFPAPVELYNLYYSIGFKPKDQGPVPERFIEWKRN